MFNSSYAVYSRCAALVLASLIVALVSSAVLASTQSNNSWLIGIGLGCLFGNTSVAAAWTALGPGPLVIRLPLSLLWIFAIVLLFGFPIGLSGGESSILLLFVVTQGSQWFLAQLPLWILVLTWRLRLRYQMEVQEENVHERQFGIGQLMIFTAIIAVMLGVGRAMLPSDFTNMQGGPPWSLFAFLVVSQLVMLLPLQFAMFLEKRALLATIASLFLIAGLAVVQWQVFLRILGTSFGPQPWDFVAINFFSTLWVLCFGLVVRFSHYHFGSGVKQTQTTIIQLANPPADNNVALPESHH